MNQDEKVLYCSLSENGREYVYIHTSQIICLLVRQKIADAENLEKSLEDEKSYGIMALVWKDKCMYNLT